MRFADRREAGRALGEALSELARRDDVVVLALPRGGVPVGYEVARRLGVPLDIFLVRKLGVPGHEEYAMGAIASGGVRVDNPEVSRHLDIAPEVMERIEARERAELARRERAYRADRAPLDVHGKVVILVDDGLATGSTMRAAVEGLRQLDPRAVIVAVPVASPEACHDLGKITDGIVCARTPTPFRAVGLWYDDFAQTTDDEVRTLLAGATGEPEGRHHAQA
jgi:putative phosphoribosyl transferase